MAMEKLFEIHQEQRYDLLVLDTPPSRNALDFLDAPKRLTQFIEGRSLQIFIRPTGLGMRIIGRGSSVVFGVLKRVTGLDLIEDLSEFFTAMSGMVAGFRERAKRVNELLADRRSTFLVVCGPAGEPIEEAVYFHHRLVEAELPFGGVIVNKVHTEGRDGSDGGPELEAELSAALDGDRGLAARVVANLDDYRALADRDARNIEKLSRELRASEVIQVPYLTEDVHDLEGLFEINEYLF
jgi:anion-transporting  ArsA/GET3 family ATPase